VAGIHDIMRDDPCRRFVYGLAIENTTARFVYHDHSDVLVSQDFDINKASEILLCTNGSHNRI
jgi:hypothetical protein